MHNQTTRSFKSHGRDYKLYDTRALTKIMRKGVPHEHYLLEHIYNRRFRGKLAIDAGAYIGTHTVWFAAVCGMRVVSFEPVHTEALKQNVALNWLDDDVTVEQVALGEGSGWVRVVDDERGGTLEPIGLENYAVPSDINIPIRSLDDYSEHAPALVKVDVNGMETQVLIGAEQMIKTHQPVVYVDITQHGQEVAVGRVLEPWGYVLQRTFVDRQSVVGEWEPQ